MDHREFIRTLPRDTLKSLQNTSNAPALRHAAGHFGFIVICSIWIAMGWPGWWFAVIPLGIAQCFLFTLAHEATHRTPFATRSFNDLAGHVAGLVLLLPFEWFRHFHLAHHRFTNIPGKDPELLAGAKPETRAQLMWHITGLPYWIGMVRQLLSNAFFSTLQDYVPKSAEASVRKEARLYLFAYALVVVSLLFTPILFWVWILPVLLGQPFLRIYLLAEHGRCAFVANVFENSRTTLTNRAVRFFAWNMPYHVEHHSLPQVPFHKLPELHQIMQGQHRVTSNGYTEFTKEYVTKLS